MGAVYRKSRIELDDDDDAVGARPTDATGPPSFPKHPPPSLPQNPRALVFPLSFCAFCETQLSGMPVFVSLHGILN